MVHTRKITEAQFAYCYPWHEEDEDCRAIRRPIDNLATLERTP